MFAFRGENQSSGKIIHEGRFRRGILFMREDFVGEYYSCGKISSGNIIHEGRFRWGILFMREGFVGEYYS